MKHAFATLAGLGLLLLTLGVARAESVPESSNAPSAIAEARAAYLNRNYQRAVDLSIAILKNDPACVDAADVLARAHARLNSANQRGNDAIAAHSDAGALIEVDRQTTPPLQPDAIARPVLPTRAECVEPERYKSAAEFLQQPVTADWQNADLDWVLNILYESSGINIVADPAAIKDKKLTLHVTNMPLEDILDFIVRNNEGIQYSVKKGNLWITATTDDKSARKLMYSRIYPLNYGLLSMKTGGGMSASNGAAGGSGAGGGANPSRPGQAGANPFAQPAPSPGAGGHGGAGGGGDEEGSYIEKALTWAKENKDPDIFPDGASFLIDRQSNQIMVYTSPTGHAKVLELLDHFDRPPVQIMIQTRFLDISDEVERSLGANLQSLSTPTTSASGSALNPSQTFTLNGSGLGTTGFLPGTLGPGSAFTIIGSRTNPQYSIQLSALLNDRKTKVLSQPQIIAVNNKEATINIGTKFEYISSLTPNVSVVPVGIGGGTSQFNGYTPQFEEQEVGFKLNVTPSVGRDLKTINLHLHPEINSLAQGQQISDFQNVNLGSQNGAQGSSTSLNFPKPTIDDSTLETDVAVEDNGYVMIGGLLQNFDEKLERKIPGLSSIPYIGNIFKSTSKDVRRRNLMIIVEVHIISAAGRQYLPDPPAASVAPATMEGAGPELRREGTARAGKQ